MSLLRRRMMMKKKPSDSLEYQADYVIDLSTKNTSNKWLDGDFSEGYNVCKNVGNGANPRIRVITKYGTYDFYNWEWHGRSIDTYTFDVIEDGTKTPQYCEIYVDDTISICFTE